MSDEESGTWDAPSDEFDDQMGERVELVIPCKIEWGSFPCGWVRHEAAIDVASERCLPSAPAVAPILASVDP